MVIPTEAIRKPILRLWTVVLAILTMLYDYWVYVFAAIRGTPLARPDVHRSTYIHDDKEITKTVVSKHLCMRRVTRETNEDTERGNKTPLVLMFPWLTAGQRSLDRYCNLYHQRDWDVLTIHGKLQHFLWPRRSEVVARELLTYLLEVEAETNRPLVVHASSIGAYLYTVFVMQLRKRPMLLTKFQHVIGGQVFDSIVIGGLGRMGNGIATSLTNNRVLRPLIRGLLFSYFRITKRQTIDFYDTALSVFYESPIAGPMLFFYSCDDPMSDLRAMEELIEHLRAQSTNDIIGKCWSLSEHAGHLRRHMDEYIQILDTFLSKLGLGDSIYTS